MVDQYSELYETFRWHVPKSFNLATACCYQWSALPSHERRAALIEHDQAGNQHIVTFSQLGRASAQLAHGLIRLGVIPGDRVIIVLERAEQVMTALLACWSIRAVAVVLSPELDAEALLPKFKQARSQVLLIDSSTHEASLSAASRCPRIKLIVGHDVYDGRVMSWRGLIARQPDRLLVSDSIPSDPALVVWPAVVPADWPAQCAMVQAHQSLIGQLPGFVAALDWFPQQAQQLLTTLKPWDDQGLWAAILPTLYFGHTVVLQPSLAKPAQWPDQVSHVVTTPQSLIESLRGDDLISASGGPKTIAILAHHGLLAHWVQRAQTLYGCTVNRATYLAGAGLLLAQSHDKWTTAQSPHLRLVPGHRIRLADESQASQGGANSPQEIEVARTDITGQTDPGLFMQQWPLKDQLDVAAQLSDWWRSGLYAHAKPDGTFELLGQRHHWHHTEAGTIEIALIEQAAWLEPEVCWSEAFIQPDRRQSPSATEVWLLVDVRNSTERGSKPWRDDLKSRLYNQVLQTLDQSPESLHVRIGLVNHDEIPKDDVHGRQRWQSRSAQALIDFL